VETAQMKVMVGSFELLLSDIDISEFEHNYYGDVETNCQESTKARYLVSNNKIN
jgi:hypothetical protein